VIGSSSEGSEGCGLRLAALEGFFFLTEGMRVEKQMC